MFRELVVYAAFPASGRPSVCATVAVGTIQLAATDPIGAVAKSCAPHQILPGTDASMAPGFETPEALAESKSNPDYWAKRPVKRSKTAAE